MPATFTVLFGFKEFPSNRIFVEAKELCSASFVSTGVLSDTLLDSSGSAARDSIFGVAN